MNLLRIVIDWIKAIKSFDNDKTNRQLIEHKNKKYICEVCNREFDDEELHITSNENKCILHCEKDDWYIVENGVKNWKSSKEKINKFWSLIQEKYICIENPSNKIIFDNIVFPIHQRDYEYEFEKDDNGYVIRDNIYDLGTNFYDFSYENNELIKNFEKYIVQFKDCKFLDELNLIKYKLENKLIFESCSFNKIEFPLNVVDSYLIFNKCNFNNKELFLFNRVFKKNIVIKNSEDIISLIDISNSNFEMSFSLFNSKIKESKFRNSKFGDIVIFDNTVFYEELNLEYVNFSENVFFDSLEVKQTFNLDKTIINKKAKFLNSKVNVKNRETARIIKDSFEQENNFIEANKYYAKEMEAYKEELTFSNFIQWIVLKLHEISSEYSQNWILPLVWIFNISALYFLIDTKMFYYVDKILIGSFVFLTVVLTFNYLNKYLKNTFILLFTIFLYIFFDIDLDEVSKLINPFSKPDNLTFSLLILKVFVAYLAYQFIVSIRQNTRRK